MAETLTTRLALRLYGAGTDTFSRTEFNDIVTQIENKAAYDDQGVFASRPTAGIRGRYYYATDTGFLYRDTGAAWTSVGNRAVDTVVTPSGAGTVPFTVSANTGQTANLFEAKVNNVVLFSVDAGGGLLSSDGYVGKYADMTGTTDRVVGDFKGAAAQTADVLRVRDSANVNLFRVLPSGALAGKYFQAGSGVGAIGTDTLTTPSSMTLFTGAPAMEVYGNKGAANAAFTEYLYLHHQAADATVASRRLGLLMQIGQAAGDVSKSGAVYIESAAASAANPDLVFARGDAVVARFRSDGTSTLDTKPTINGTVTITPGTFASVVSGSTAIGTHAGNDLYLRTNTNNGVYLYAGGVHSASGGDAGAGGVRLASFTKSGSVGIFATDRIEVGVGSRALASTTQSIRVGTAGGTRLNVSEDGIQAVTSTASSSTLNLNTAGGNMNLGTSGTSVTVPGALVVGGYRITANPTAPSSPSTGDIWLDNG